MIGITINLPDDQTKHVKQFIAPTPTAEIMKTHIQRWTRKNYFHLWFREHYRKVVGVLKSRVLNLIDYTSREGCKSKNNFKLCTKLSDDCSSKKA